MKKTRSKLCYMFQISQYKIRNCQFELLQIKTGDYISSCKRKKEEKKKKSNNI